MEEVLIVGVVEGAKEAEEAGGVAVGAGDEVGELGGRREVVGGEAAAEGERGSGGRWGREAGEEKEEEEEGEKGEEKREREAGHGGSERGSPNSGNAGGVFELIFWVGQTSSSSCCGERVMQQ